MLSNVLVLLLAAFPLMGSPGPATLSLAAMGSAYGVNKSIPYYAGIVAGTIGVLIMIGLGLTSILLAQPKLAMIISLAAAIYILYLAFKIATAPVGRQKSTNTTAPSMQSGFLLAIANPKAFAAIGAVYSGNVLVVDSLIQDSLIKLSLIHI